MVGFASSDIGKAREINQDYYSIPKPEDSLQLFILADGMGGYNGGEIASSLATASAKSYIENNFDKIEHNKEAILELIKNAIEYANMVVFEKRKAAMFTSAGSNRGIPPWRIGKLDKISCAKSRPRCGQKRATEIRQSKLISAAVCDIVSTFLLFYC